MSLNVLLGLMLLSGLLLLIRWRWGLVSLVATLAWVVLVGSAFLPGLLLIELQAAPPLENVNWKPKNLIIALGGGIVVDGSPRHEWLHMQVYPRVHEAARLYHQCKDAGVDCQVLVAGGDPAGWGVSEAEIMRRSLEEMRVAKADILIENQSRNTFENGKFIKNLFSDQLAASQVVLVTSGYHLKRAMNYFKHFGIAVIPVPADRLLPRPGWWPSAYNAELTDLAVHEVVGILRYPIYNLFGWN